MAEIVRRSHCSNLKLFDSDEKLATGKGSGCRQSRAKLARDFGSFERWRIEFVAMGKALGGGSGWVLLTYSHRDRKLINQWAADHTHSLAGATPVLALDMYEHSYHMDYGAAAATTGARAIYSTVAGRSGRGFRYRRRAAEDRRQWD